VDFSPVVADRRVYAGLLAGNLHLLDRDKERYFGG
jgi:hypothetical protein